MPHPSQVAGMNCVQPAAPALEVPMLHPKPDSTWVIAASTCHLSSKALAAASQIGRSACAAPAQGAMSFSPELTERACPALGAVRTSMGGMVPYVAPAP